MGRYVSKSKNNIIDDKVNTFIKEGKLPPLTLERKLSLPWWAKFVEMLEESDIDFILSVEQSGNWNTFLYEAAQRTRTLNFYISEE